VSVRTIVCFGDSLTNGARDEFHRNYPAELNDILNAAGWSDHWCLNYGINGDTTGGMVNRAYSVLAGARGARFVLFLGGTNDTKIPLPADLYERNVDAIVRLAKTMEIEPVLGLLPPLYGPGLPCYSKEQGNAAIASYNAKLSAIAERTSLRTCDFSTYDAALYSDGVHLNHAGYEQMARDWFASIEAAL
jgi:lysophospholipase L1-like esterase